MRNLINLLMKAVRYYTATDFAVLKIYVLSVGILLGSYFSTFFLNWISIVWAVAVVGLIILLAQTIRYCRKMKE